MSMNYWGAITSDGKHTNVWTSRKGGAVGYGTARCDDGDEFKPEIGAVIAMCRAFGKDVKETCELTLEAMKRRAEYYAKKEKDSKHVMVHKRPDMHGVQVGTIKLGHGILRKGKTYMGRMGRPTMFFDRNGKPLSVGDLVTVDVLVGDVRTGRKWTPAPGLHFVVDAKDDDPDFSGQFIMGILTACNEHTGKIDSHYRVKLAKTWREVEFDDTHDGVKVEWEGES